MLTGLDAALIVYFVSILPSIKGGLYTVGWVFGAAYPFFVLMLNYLNVTDGSEEKINIIKPLVVLGAISLTFATILPSQKTAYYMVGAYAGAEIIRSEKAVEIGNTSYSIIINTLKKWESESKGDEKEETTQDVKKEEPTQTDKKVETQPQTSEKSADVDKAVEVIGKTATAVKEINEIVNK